MGVTNIVVDFSESSTLVPLLGLFVLLVGVIGIAVFALIKRGKKSESQADTLIGEVGVALDNISNSGQIQIKGEIWNARSKEGIISKGENALVTGTAEGLVLEVTPNESNLNKQ